MKQNQTVSRQGVRTRLFVFLTLTVLLFAAVLFSHLLCPYDPNAQNTAIALQPPSAAHLFGTDRFGRDLFSRVLVGTKTSLFTALFLVAVTATLGTITGMVSAYRGGALDTLLMRLSDLCLAFPGLLFAMAIAAMLGGGLKNAALALLLTGWPKYARLARSQTLTLKDAPFLDACALAGASTTRLLFSHILPNIAPTLLVTAALDIGTTMMELAGLSFLGLGAAPPTAELGSMMSDGRSMLQTSPWVILAPGLAIFIVVSCFNLLGDALRDVLDPRSASRRFGKDLAP
jgi:peptide/nickel transport system permease protein